MKRKVIQLSGRTLVVTLPKEWASDNNITKGDYLDFEVGNDSDLILRPSDRSVTYEPRSTCIDVSALDERVVRWLLSSLHKKGFDEINIRFTDRHVLDVVNELVKDLFVGFTIVSQTENTCTVKSISLDSHSDFDAIFRRAFMLMLQMGQEVLAALREQRTEALSALVAMEHMNNQLTNFCERLLNKEGYEDYDSTCFMYVIVWNLEKVCDDHKYICEYFGTKAPKAVILREEVLDLYGLTNKLSRDFYDLFYKFEIQGLNALRTRKSGLEARARDLLESSNVQDAILIGHLLDIMNRVMDFSASTIALKSF